MARVTFEKGQRITHLSGQIGNLIYRTVGGKTFVFEAEGAGLPKNATRKQKRLYKRKCIIRKTFVFEAEGAGLPKNATRKQKRLYKRKCIINECVELIQRQVGDIDVALAMRTKIRDRMRSLYDRLAPEIKARTKLQRAMITEYKTRFDIENDSIMIREKLGIDSTTIGKEL